MDDMTQQNAALVEQAAAAAASLHEQTVNLARAVSIFRIEDSQDEAAPAAPERRAPDSPMRGRPALAHHLAADDDEDAPRPRRAANGR
jgi:methyl-accepting chemotaxis protein